MKNYIFAIILSIVAASIFSMDLATKPRSEELIQRKRQRIPTIDTALTQRYQNNTIFCALITKNFSEKNHFNLLTLVDSFYKKGIPLQDIPRLRNKNIFFAQTMRYFSDIARQNFDKVTLNTLTIITDFEKQQPTPQLNKLSPALKQYVMQVAYNTFRRVHSIQFSGHTAPIGCIDINTKVLLACSTSKDKTFRLWDLATGKELCTLPENAVHGYAKFNDDGSLLATATVLQKKPFETEIRIWDTKSHENTWSIKRKRPFTALAFFHNDIHTTLAILEASGSELYALEKYREPIYLGTHTQTLSIIKDKGNQEYTIKKNPNHTWTILKSAPRLYLCEQAIKNATHIPPSFKIKKIPLFQNMIESEQEIVTDLLNAKMLNTCIPIN